MTLVVPRIGDAPEPGSAYADGVLTSDHPDPAPRWTPGERLHHVVEARCDAAPDSLAVDRGGERLTHAELDAVANRFARLLRRWGIGAGDRVGLLFDDPVPAYAAMLAVSKIHAAYVPLDQAFPDDRIAFICEDAGVSAVLAPMHLLDRVPHPIAAHEADGSGERLTAEEAGEPVDELAYVIYTSGTTGRPKGVPIEHASIVNFLRVAAETYGIRPGDRIYQGMTIAFDFSVEEIWVPLVAGATLVPRPRRSLVGDELTTFLRDERVTALACVPTLLATLDADDLPDLRFLLVSGEACPQDLVARWHRPGRRFLNVYGPTEATVTATWTTLHPDEPVTIGVPLPTYSVLVLDEDGTVLDRGEQGELAIAGIGLSPGYLNRPDKTAAAFVEDPAGLPHNPSGQLYRTGDLARITRDGLVEYLGRIDTQVKIRGYRIELTEVESLLLQVPGVAQAVVDTTSPTPDSTELVGYWTQRRGGPDVDPADVHARLSESLPAYMVPAYLERLDEIPRLPSDKADRSKLPPPSGSRMTATTGEHVEPDGEREEVVAAAVAGLLGVERVSATSDLFAELGLTSLLTAKLSAALRDRPELPSVGVREIFENPTVRGLVAALDGREAAGTTAEREIHRVSGLRYAVTGVLQVLLLLTGAGLSTLVLLGGYAWMQAATGPLEVWVRGSAYGTAVVLGSALAAIVAKWTLIGRFTEREFPLWGGTYLRFWLARRLMALSAARLFAGTPLHNLYLRALGVRVGRGAVVLTRRLIVATDLVEIGAGAVVRKDVLLTGYRAESGRIRTGRVHVGAGAVVGEASVLDVDTVLGDRAQLGHASSLRAGQAVTTGTRVAGSPAVDVGTDFDTVPPLPVRRGIGYGVFQLVLLVLVSAPLVSTLAFVVVPALYGLAAGNLLGLLAVAAGLVVALVVVRLAALVALPPLLARFVPVDTPLPLWGVRFALHRAIVRLSNSALLHDLFGDSALAVPFLRMAGYELRPVHQTGSNFGLATRHEAPGLVHIGTGTLVSDGLSISNADFSATSFRLSRAGVGKQNFVGNNVLVPAGARTGDDVLLATKVMVPIDGEVQEHTGLLGSPAFRIPRSTQREEIDADAPQLTRRTLAAKTRSNLTGMVAYLAERVLLSYVTLLVVLGLTTLLTGLGPVVGYLAALVAAAVVGTIGSILVERAAMGFRRLRPRFCSIYTPYYWRHERLWKLSRGSFLPIFAGTPLSGPLWRLAGVRVGRRLYDGGAVVPEKTLVTIGDDACVNVGVVIQCHSLEDATFRSDAVRIGDGVTLGTNSFVHYGTDVGDRVVLDADSFLMKGTAPAADTRWRGNPAREVPDTPPREVPLDDRLPARRAVLVTAAAAAFVLTAGTVTGALHDGPGAAAGPSAAPVALVAWLDAAVDPDAVLTADPALQDELVAAGVPGERFAAAGDLLVRSATAPGAGDLAFFGSGDEALAVAPAVPLDPMAGSGAALTGNPALVAPEPVRELLRAGAVDRRALAVLAALAGAGPVEVRDLPVVPGETAAVPRHAVVLAAPDDATLAWLAAQRPPYAPELQPGDGVTTLFWPVPAPAPLEGT